MVVEQLRGAMTFSRCKSENSNLVRILQIVVGIRMVQVTSWGKPSIKTFRCRWWWYPARRSSGERGSWKRFGGQEGVMKSHNGVVHHISGFGEMWMKERSGEREKARGQGMSSGSRRQMMGGSG